MSIGTGTDLGGTGLGGLGVGGSGPGDEPGTAPLPPPIDAPIRGRRIRLPRSPKIIAGLVMLAVFLIVAAIGPLVAPYNPSASSSTTNGVPQPPSAAHWLGTTQLQQDVFSQLLAGGRSTILVAFLAGIAATILSVVIGVCAGYLHGRWADELLSMLANFFLVLPALPLLIVIFGFLSPSGATNDVLIGLIIAVTGWAWGARVLRAQTLSLRSRDYVDSARIIGERGWRVISHEILPNLLPIVASSFLFTVLYGVGTYTALAFLGLINPEHWSWGSMLFEAQNSDAEISGYWWWYIPPGLAVAFLGTSLALLNFGIDEFINPRLRAAGLTRRQSKKSGGKGLPRRFELGLTPVVRSRPAPGAAASTAAAQHGSPQHGPDQPDAGADVMTAQPLLEIRGLRVDYGAGEGAVHAVVDADLVLRRGEVLGLAGESGSGKSTLAYAAIRLLRAPGMITGGEVLYHAEPGRPVDLLDLDEPELRRLRWSQIAVVLQSAMNALNPVLSIGAQLTDVLQAHVARPGRRGPAGPRRRTARHGRHHRRPAQQLPARTVRRDAAARHDRDGPGAGAPGGDPGRADHRAGRGDPAGDPRGTDRAARAAGLRGPVHHPRPVAAGRDRGLDRGDVRGPPGRAGRGGRALPRPPPPVHAGAAELVPRAARPAPVHDRHPRLSPGPADAAGRLRVPPPLPLRDGHLPRAVTAAGAARRLRRPDI